MQASVTVAMSAAEGGAYEAVITADDAPALLRDLVAARFPGRPCFVVADREVATRYAAPVRAALAGAHLITVRSGEAAKSLAEVERVAGELLAAGIDRSGLLFSLGGGALGDLVGFVAATLLRGLDYVHLPTTLLAMVDSAIGGKTAVNLAAGKNLLGAFHQPRLVLCDLQTLGSLERRDRASGLAEVLKHALLEGEPALAALEQAAPALVVGPPASLLEVVRTAIDFKARVVAADPRELVASALAMGARPLPITGRITLNLGHTIGHALERSSYATAEPLRHGEAVGLGLLAEARIGARLGLWADGPRRLAALLPRLGLDHELAKVCAGMSADLLLGALAVDKKRAGGCSRLVLLEAPGRAVAVTLDGARVLEMLLSQNVE